MFREEEGGKAEEVWRKFSVESAEITCVFPRGRQKIEYFWGHIDINLNVLLMFKEMHAEEDVRQDLNIDLVSNGDNKET